jgi:polyferredoxin
MVVSFIPQPVGMIYAFIAISVIIYLYRIGRFRAPIQILLLCISTLLGFLIFAPIAPYQFQQVLLGQGRQLGVPLEVVLFFLILFIAITLLVGRAYCSSVCPIGAIQELLSRFPGPKISIPWKREVLIIHVIISGIITIIPLILVTNRSKCMGIGPFFQLEFTSIYFWFFALVMVIGIAIYRPFCRFVCPYGLLLTAASYFSIFRLTRTNTCIKCKKCENVCPVGEAFADSNKSECFLCGRCTKVCPVEGALMYSNQKTNQKNR